MTKPAPSSDRAVAPLIVGAFVLAAVAGAVNSSSLVAWDTAVSHLTGAISRGPLDLYQANTAHYWLLARVAVGFFAGAVIAGWLIESDTLRMGRRYGAALVLEGTLFVAASFVTARPALAVALLALGCGLQNGMAVLHEGAVLRTTHMTGVVTDIGTAIGARLSGRPVATQRLTFHATLLAGFLTGAAVGVFGSEAFGPDHVIRAVGLTAIAMGVGYRAVARPGGRVGQPSPT
ncbi:MAG: DUF1275 domain-containing protein [Myxococcales bacterium]|nr:DUF1275 domain-containing protein [Myxococcales bacterium]